MEHAKYAFVKFLYLVHLLFFIFALLGWASPWRALLLAYIIYIPLMILQWWANDGMCILTNIENHLLGKQLKVHEERGQFIKRILAWFCDPIPRDATIKKWMYVLLIVLWVISLVRYF